MTISFTSAELTRLNYNGIILGLYEVIYQQSQSNYDEALIKLKRIKRKIEDLARNIFGIDSVKRYFGHELNISELKEISKGLETNSLGLSDTKKSLEELLIKKV